MSEFGPKSKDASSAYELPDNFDLEMKTLGKVLYEQLLNKIDNLREEKVLRAFIEDDMTGEEVGRKFGFTADKARKMKAKALDKIKKSPLGKQLILDNFNKTGKL